VRPASEERIRFEADGLRLEGHLVVPADAGAAAVVCHPHPLYGGTMDSNVVLAVVRALADAGIASLRFNFRGVGSSDGEYGDGDGEVRDVAGAVACVRERVDGAEMALVGYSFGAMVALRAGASGVAAAARMVGIAPPLAMMDLGFLRTCALPLLLVAGDRDSYCSRDALAAQAAALGGRAATAVVPEADHFFHGHEQAVGSVVRRFLQGEAAA
jgi:alpha/beta superfamily hydrolase